MKIIRIFKDGTAMSAEIRLAQQGGYLRILDRRTMEEAMAAICGSALLQADLAFLKWYQQYAQKYTDIFSILHY